MLAEIFMLRLEATARVGQESTATHNFEFFRASQGEQKERTLPTRDAILAKARAWVADLAEGRAASFAEIAKLEAKVEGHIRLLAPLAFVSPQFVSGIIDGHVPSVAVTALAKHVSWPWAPTAN